MISERWWYCEVRSKAGALSIFLRCWMPRIDIVLQLFCSEFCQQMCEETRVQEVFCRGERVLQYWTPLFLVSINHMVQSTFAIHLGEEDLDKSVSCGLLTSRYSGVNHLSFIHVSFVSCPVVFDDHHSVLMWPTSKVIVLCKIW